MARRSLPAERGQVLVIVALGLVILLGAASFAIDLGRHAAQERYIQNAADAGALAACRALVEGASDNSARDTADTIARTNLQASPVGADATLPTTAEPLLYADGHLGDPSYLTGGVLVSGTTVRVAIQSDVPTTLGAVLGVEVLTARGRARCGLEAGPGMPIVARRYDNAPGPGGSFVDFTATQATSGSGGVDPVNVLGYNGRTPASELQPGPEFDLYGPGAKAANQPNFRGFIALDIRNFSTTLSRVYHNGVAFGTNPNTIKTMQGDYITAGYPGPGFPPVQTPPDPNDQVAVMSGNDTAMVMGNFSQRYSTGDRVLLAVYNGTVMQIPDFSLTPPAAITLPASGTTNGPSFTVSRNSEFNSTVTLHLHGDHLATDPAHDLIPTDGAASAGPGLMTAPTFSPNVFLVASRGTTVQMQNIATNAVPAGIYTVWLEGHSGDPYFQTRRGPVAVRIGGAVRDFSFGNSGALGTAVTIGAPVDIPLLVSTAGGSSTWGSSPVTLSVDAASFMTCNYTAASIAPGAITLSSGAVVPSTGSGSSSTVTVQTAGLGSGCYTFNVRGTGTNGAGQPVTHIWPVQVLVATAAGGGSYVDIIGFAAFEVTDVDANGFSGRAISSVYADSSDPALRRVQSARLMPW
jgi:hypothetical protein